MLKLSAVQRVLLYTCIFIVSFILITTCALLISGRFKPGKTLRKTDIQPEELSQTTVAGNQEAFTGLGTIRTGTHDKPSVPIVITPFFSYPADDTQYYEELCRKTDRISLLIKNYFAEFTKEQLLENGEQKVKKDLLQLINDELVLGQISTLYFEQYIFFD